MSVFLFLSQRHDPGHDAVNLLDGLLLVRFDVPGRICLDHCRGQHPAQYRIPEVFYLLREHQLLELLCGRFKKAVALPFRN